MPTCGLTTVLSAHQQAEFTTASVSCDACTAAEKTRNTRCNIRGTMYLQFPNFAGGRQPWETPSLPRPIRLNPKP